MMPLKQLDELEALHTKGVGIREIILAAYQSGQAAELRAAYLQIPAGRIASEYGNDEIRWPDGLQHYGQAAKPMARKVVPSGPMGELVTAVEQRRADQDIMTRGLTEYQEIRGGCYDDPGVEK